MTARDEQVENTPVGDEHVAQRPDENTNVLFEGSDRESFEQRWSEVQTQFVDEPRQAVEAADGLVAEVIDTLTRRFADRRSSLETQWSQSGEVETEELRVLLHQYRAFFRRLLAA